MLFLRLHDIHVEFTNFFQCLICAQNPDVVICDGTMLGFRKDFLAVNHLDHQQEDMPLLSGTMHKDRVHILPEDEIRYKKCVDNLSKHNQFCSAILHF